MKDYYGKDATRLKDKKLFLFDMDGTIYLGDNLFEGVPELLQKIENKGAGTCLLRTMLPNLYPITW